MDSAKEEEEKLVYVALPISRELLRFIGFCLKLNCFYKAPRIHNSRLRRSHRADKLGPLVEHIGSPEPSLTCEVHPCDLRELGCMVERLNARILIAPVT